MKKHNTGPRVVLTAMSDRSSLPSSEGNQWQDWVLLATAPPSEVLSQDVSTAYGLREPGECLATLTPTHCSQKHPWQTLTLLCVLWRVLPPESLRARAALSSS